MSSEDPVRVVTELWSLDGRKLAEFDPYLGEEINEQEKPKRQLSAKITVDCSNLEATLEEVNRQIDSRMSGNEKIGS